MEEVAELFGGEEAQCDQIVAQTPAMQALALERFSYLGIAEQMFLFEAVTE